MPRMKVTIAYDGTHFSGYQIQPSVRTVQGELEAVLKMIHKGGSVRIYASGRTDTGVHALGQTLHFDTPISMDEDSWKKALHALSPDDIVVQKVKQVASDFHARFHATKKEYRYRLLTNKQPDVFRRHYTYHVPQALDINAMKEGMAIVIGTHDFSSFCAAKTGAEDKIRTIFDANLYEDGDELVFCFIGNGFLYNMVRILVGTFLEIGLGKRNPDDIQDILSARSRSKAGKTAPAHGLVLWSVTYD